MSRLKLDAHTLFLAEADVLYVVNRRGIFELRAKKIDYLHGKLHPNLDGRYREEDLLNSAPEKSRPLLQSYFAKLRAVGCFEAPQEEAAAQTPEAPEDPVPSLPALATLTDRGSLRLDGHRVFVSFEGFDRRALRDHVCCLFFVTPREAGHILLNAHRFARYPASVSLITIEPGEEGKPAASLDLRRAYARWLIHHEQALGWTTQHVGAYALDAQHGTLKRLFRLPGMKTADLRHLPPQLGWITISTHDQVPLISATAAHPFFAPHRVGYGLHRDVLYQQLQRALIARLWVARSARGGTVRLRRGLPDPSTPPARLVDVATHRVAQIPVAASRFDLWMQALERWAFEQAGPHETLPWRPRDLLRHDTTHPDARHLQDVLRLRRKSIEAYIAYTEDGLFIGKADGHTAYSFYREKALTDLLLALVIDTFYGEASGGELPMQTSSYAAFTRPGAHRARIRALSETLAQRYGRIDMLYRDVEIWGIRAWVGDLAHERKRA